MLYLKLVMTACKVLVLQNKPFTGSDVSKVLAIVFRLGRFLVLLFDFCCCFCCFSRFNDPHLHRHCRCRHHDHHHHILHFLLLILLHLLLVLVNSSLLPLKT